MLLCPAMVLKVNNISLRIKVKEKPGQQTGIERANIKAASFSGEFCNGIDVHIFLHHAPFTALLEVSWGGTERQILKNVDNIVKAAFPLDKVSGYYQDSECSGQEEVMEYLVFFQQRKEYIQSILDNKEFERDYGNWQEKVALNQCQELRTFLDEHWYWQDKQ